MSDSVFFNSSQLSIQDKNLSSSYSNENQQDKKLSDNMEIEDIFDNSNQSDNKQNTESDNSKKIQCFNNKKKRIRDYKHLSVNKIKFNDVIWQYEYLTQLPIEKILSTKIQFYLAGGIVVDFINSSNLDSNDIISRTKSIQSIQKFYDGSLQISMENKVIQHEYDHAIHILQSTQNEDDYRYSIQLIANKNRVIQLKQQIDRLISIYDSNKLQQLIYLRQVYRQQIQQKYIEDIKDDEFCQLVSYHIDWNLKSVANLSFFLSKSMIHLLGSSSDDFVNFAMRKNLYWIITPQSRRRLAVEGLKNLKYLKDQYTLKIQDLEIRMIDNILIKCDCYINTILIQYPMHLNFYGQDIDLLNKVECFSIVKYDITQEHLEKIIKTRQSIIESKQQNEETTELDEYIINNFEYYMQSQIFLQKFYQDKQNKQDIAFGDLFRCNFRYIN